MSEMITDLSDAELDVVGAAGRVSNSFFVIAAWQNNQNYQSASSYSFYSRTNQQNAQSNQIVVGNGSGNGVANNS